MKINPLEAHDRLDYFKKEQNANVFNGANDCMKKNELSLMLQEHSPYIYIFAHPRTHDDGVTKRMLWQPRLMKPTAQTNSYLFRALSHTDLIEIIWLLPPREMWPQYEKGKVTASDLVMQSIDDFLNHRDELNRPDPQDMPDEKAFEIYKKIDQEMKMKRKFTPLI